MVSKRRSIALTLTRKDFAEILLHHQQLKQAEWLETLQEIPFLAELPYSLVKDVSGVLFGPQHFAADEVVYNSGDDNCDALYFVEEGSV